MQKQLSLIIEEEGQNEEKDKIDGVGKGKVDVENPEDVKMSEDQVKQRVEPKSAGLVGGRLQTRGGAISVARLQSQ